MTSALVVRELALAGPDRAGALALRAAAFPLTEGADAVSDEIEAGIDAACRHFAVCDAQGAMLALWRLQIHVAGEQISQGYAGQFHDLSPLAGQRGPFLELGRFCLCPGLGLIAAAQVLRAAWRQIEALVAVTGVRVLFGCASFQGGDPARHHAALALLAEAHLLPPALRPGPRAAPFSRLIAQDVPLSAEARAAGLRGLPPLLRSYLGLGARVGDVLVVDAQLDTLHLLTWLEVGAVPSVRARSIAGRTGRASQSSN